MHGEVGMHHGKNSGNQVPLAILSRILAQSCSLHNYYTQAKGLRMIVLVSLIVLLRELLLFPLFFAWCMPTSPLSQLNNVYTIVASYIYITSHSVEFFYTCFIIIIYTYIGSACVWAFTTYQLYQIPVVCMQLECLWKTIHLR